MRTRHRLLMGLLGTGLLTATGVTPALGSAADPPDPCAAPTIVGTESGEHIVGTDGPDVIAALGGDDVVDGGGGADVICGGEGGDRLDGGDGADRLYGQGHVYVTGSEAVIEWRPDVLDGGPGDDHLDAGGSWSASERGGDIITYADAPAGVTVDLAAGVATGEGTDSISDTYVVGDNSHWNVIGSAFADTLLGDEDANLLVGGGGDDEVSGRGGGDFLYDGLDISHAPAVEGGGDDVFAGGGGADFLAAGAGDDALVGGAAPDYLSAGGGHDDLVGGRASDALLGGAGRDDLRDLARRGADIFRGERGDDTVVNVVSARGEDAYGGSGVDRVAVPRNRLGVRMRCRSMEIDRSRGACR